MATQAIRGRTCKVRISTTAAGGGLIFNEVRNWSISPTQEMLDASSADSSGWNEFIPGQRGFVFRAETVFVPNVASGVASVDINNVLKSFFTEGGRIAALKIEVNTPPVAGGGNSGQWLAGSTALLTSGRAGFVSNCRIGGTLDNIQLFDFEITGNAVLRYTSGSS